MHDGPRTISEPLKASLPELCALAPDIWTEVIASIRKSVADGRIDHLADTSQRAQASIVRCLNSNKADTPQSMPASSEIIRARMTILAVEQFIEAFTSPNGKLGFSDNWRLNFSLIRHLNHGKLLTINQFDETWASLKDRTMAARLIQKTGFWSIPTKELCLGIKHYAGDDYILEVGAGRGLFVAGLEKSGAQITGVDDCSWEMAHQKISSAAKKIKQQDARQALAEIKPKTVLAVWPPPGNSFEAEIFATSSVKTYIAIVSRHKFASGNWREYQSQDKNLQGFSCTTNERLNAMLRPLEAEQTVLIFKRKKS
jgi:hypothetical protein